MKKVLWLIVCLMTMVTFTSCSSDDDMLPQNNIEGMWHNEDGTELFFGPDFYVVSSNNVPHVNGTYEIKNNTIVFCYANTEYGVSYEKQIEFYRKKIEELRKELNKAQGDSKYYFLRQIDEYSDIIKELNSKASFNKHNKVLYDYAKIKKLTPYILTIIIDTSSYDIGVDSIEMTFKKKV